MGQQIGSFFKSKYTGQQIENMLDSATNIADQYDPAASYVVGDLVLYNNGLYVCTGATTGTFDQSKWQQTTLDEILTNLGATYNDPNSDGNVVVGVDSTVGEKILRSLTFPGLTNRYYLPFAQYIRERLANDPDNASFDVEIPDAEEAPMHSTVIKGKTVAVNQLVQNGNFADGTTGWTALNQATLTASGKVATLTATSQNGLARSTAFNGVSGHLYYVSAMLKTTTATNQVQINPTGMGSWYIAPESSTNWQTVEGIKAAPSTGSKTIDIMDRRSSGWDAVQFTNVKTIDLNTSPVASRLTEIGTDVAKLKQVWLEEVGTPLPQYIPYDAGSLVNVDGTYRLRGRNIWDEEWEVGGINNNTGLPDSVTNVWRSKNFIPINPNEDYYFRCASFQYNIYRYYFYDANKDFIGETDTFRSNNFHTPDNARYLKIRSTTAAGATYTYDICINLSDSSINGQYFPYYNGGEIDCSASPLNGIGSAQDEKDFATGERTTRCGNFTPGDVTWTRSGDSPSGGNLFVYSYLTDRASGRDKLIMSHYPNDESASSAPNIRNGYCWTHPNNKNVYVRDDAYSDAASFKAHLQAINAQGCYELATPVTTTETPQPVYTQYGYNVLEPVSGGVQSAEVDTTYYENIAGYIDKKLAEG